uniref:Reverse transcriptase domain-containing protein n=1 Tax=Tanacetum cinerariifolium TaxID=118510 RepID=A0A699GNR2_TANCI|nr:hypothetical protein [Tanacetum cinerariifolium]
MSTFVLCVGCGEPLYGFHLVDGVLLLAWDRVSEIKDALGNKQYKPEDIHELFRKLFNDVQNIHEELAEYINTPSWNRPIVYYDDDDDDDDDDDEDYTIAITLVLPIEEPKDSLIMGDEHLDTIPKKESDEFTKSSVENLVSSPKSNLIESLLHRNTLIDSASKIDSLLDEFAGELIFLKPIPPGIDEADFDPKGDISLIERLLYVENSIESFSLSPIPNEDSDSLKEEIDLFLTSDDSMPPGIENDDYDSERDIFFLE